VKLLVLLQDGLRTNPELIQNKTGAVTQLNAQPDDPDAISIVDQGHVTDVTPGWAESKMKIGNVMASELAPFDIEVSADVDVNAEIVSFYDTTETSEEEGPSKGE